LPVLRNRLVLRIARGLTGFINFEAGLIRGVLPEIERPEGQLRQLGQARKKLKEQDRQLSTLKAQLARRDNKIQQLKQQSAKRLADKDVELRKARVLVRQVGRRLYSLGFRTWRRPLHRLDRWQRLLHDFWIWNVWFLSPIPVDRMGYGQGLLTWIRLNKHRRLRRKVHIALLDPSKKPRFGPLQAFWIKQNCSLCSASLNLEPEIIGFQKPTPVM